MKHDWIPITLTVLVLVMWVIFALWMRIARARGTDQMVPIRFALYSIFGFALIPVAAIIADGDWARIIRGLVVTGIIAMLVLIKNLIVRLWR